MSEPQHEITGVGRIMWIVFDDFTGTDYLCSISACANDRVKMR